MDANQIKAALIDHLLGQEREAGLVVGAEIPFDDGRRKADLVAIDDLLFAFEIKSDRDRIDTVLDQLSDYRACFPVVYVASGPEHVAQMRAKLPRRIGLLTVSPAGVKRVRKADASRRMPRLKAVGLLTRRELESVLFERGLLPNNPKRITTEVLRRAAASNIPADELVCCVRREIRKRLEPRFREFLQHRGEVTHTEDLYYLNWAPVALT
jgi:hypothetical protein